MSFEMTEADWSRKILQEVISQALPGRTKHVDLFGQENAVKQIKPFLSIDRPMPHTLLRGEPGVGKTHFARWVAYQRMETFEEVTCPVTPGELPLRGIVLLDEVHRQVRPENLFTIMDKSVTVTIFGATTRPDKLDPAFASRFFLNLYLMPLGVEAAQEMLASLVSVSEESAPIYAQASAGNARQVERIAEVVKRIGDDPDRVLAACQVTGDGISNDQITYMLHLKRSGRPLGVAQIALMMYSDEFSVKRLERQLLEKGLVELQVKGRTLTPLGLAYLDLLTGP